MPPPIARSNSARPLGSRAGRAVGVLQPDKRYHSPATLQIMLGSENARDFGAFLDEGVPLGAVGALALPAVGDRPAGLTRVSAFHLRHGGTIHEHQAVERVRLRPCQAAARREQVSFLPEPLRIPSFRYFWVARLSTTIAQMAMVIVIGWQVYDIARHTMGVKEAALRLGPDRPGAVHPSARIDAGHWLDCRPRRPTLGRPSVGSAGAWLRGRARLVRVAAHDDTANPLRGCGAARRCPCVCRAGAWSTGAEPRPP